MPNLTHNPLFDPFHFPPLHTLQPPREHSRIRRLSRNAKVECAQGAQEEPRFKGTRDVAYKGPVGPKLEEEGNNL